MFSSGIIDPHFDKSMVWATAFYWIFEVFSTVGYGDFSYSTNWEKLFALICEFTGVAFNAIILTLLAGIFDEHTYEVLLSQKMDELMIWTRKLELCNQKEKDTVYLKPELYLDMQRYVRDAFLYDHNLVVEEFNLYQLLPHRMQSEVIETLDVFQRFVEKFSTFFKPCEIGFRNEFVIQMYTRELPPKEVIVDFGKKFREIFFVMEGKVDMKKGDQTFMQLGEGNIFGDYQVLFDLQSNIIYEVAARDDVEADPEDPDPSVNINSKFMGCEAGVVEELCELYPKTAENLKMRSLEKRAVYHYYMGEPSSVIKRHERRVNSEQNSGIGKSQRSMKREPVSAQSSIGDLLKIVP